MLTQPFGTPAYRKSVVEQYWKLDPATGQRDVEGVRVDAGLTTAIDASPFPIAGGSGRQDGPRVAFDGLDWLVVFEHSLTTGDYQVMATRVSQAGAVLDPAWIPVSTAYSTVPGRAGVAFDGRNFVVEWRDSRDGTAVLDLWVRTVAPDGALLGSEQLVFDGVPGTRLARVGSAGWNRALVAFTEDVDGTAARNPEGAHGTRIAGAIDRRAHVFAGRLTRRRGRGRR